MRKGFMWRRPSLQKAVLRTLWSLFRSNGKRIPMRTQINYGMFCWSIENQMPCSEEVSAAVWASGRNRLRRRPDWSALPATLRCTTWMWSHLHSKMPFENRPRSWRVSVQESLRSNEERLQKGSQVRKKMLWRVRWLQRKVETKLALWTFNFHWMLSQRWRHLLLVSLLLLISTTSYFNDFTKPLSIFRELVMKVIPECGHQVKLACSTEPSRAHCKNPCVCKLPCGHLCMKKCNEPCDEADCNEPVSTSRVNVCGHHVTVLCKSNKEGEFIECCYP